MNDYRDPYDDEPEPDLRNDPDYERWAERYDCDTADLLDGYADEVML